MQVDDAPPHRLADGTVLVVLAVGGYLQLVHLVTEAVAVELGFDSAAVDDLRLATDELAEVLVDLVDGDTRLELHFHADAEDLYVRLVVPHVPRDARPDDATLEGDLLAFTVDSVGVGRRGDEVEAVIQRALPL